MPKEYIDREVALRAILGQPPDAHYPGWYADSIKGIPAADVVPVVHGEWEPYQPPNESRQVGWICTNCSSVIRDLSNGDTDFCPHCGAKMDGGGHGN